MCFGNYMAAAQCEELHEDYLFPHFQLILLVHPHNLPLLLWKNYTEIKSTFCFEASRSVQRFPSNRCSTTADMDVKENSSRLEDSGKLFLKQLKLKPWMILKLK